MRRRKRGLTHKQLMTYLASAEPTAYICFTYQISVDGLYRAGVTILVDGHPISGLDIRETFPTKAQALAAAYNAACERERAIWSWDSALPIGVN